MFQTIDGRPLVRCQDTWRVDSVGKAFHKLLARCEAVRPLPFKYLRKTGATMIEQATDGWTWRSCTSLTLAAASPSATTSHATSMGWPMDCGHCSQLLAPVFSPQQERKAA